MNVTSYHCQTPRIKYTCPSLLRDSTSTPCATRNFTTSRRPAWHAPCNLQAQRYRKLTINTKKKHGGYLTRDAHYDGNRLRLNAKNCHIYREYGKLRASSLTHSSHWRQRNSLQHPDRAALSHHLNCLDSKASKTLLKPRESAQSSKPCPLKLQM